MTTLRHILALFLAFLSCATFAAEPEITVNITKSGEAFVIDAAVDLAIPLRTVWDVLTDFDNMAGIVSNLTSSKVVSRQGNTLSVQQEGKAKYGLFSYTFASEREIRLEPKTKIFAKQVTGTAKRFESEMALSRVGSGTTLRYHAEIVPDSGLGRTFGRPFIQHEVEEQLAAMVAEMERRKPI
jgi:carbon monoxide dehydrogenase subunit G